MRRFLLCFALALTVATVVLSQLNCAAPSNDNAATTNTTTTTANTTANANAPAASTAAVEAELIQMERDWSNTAKTHDAETVKRVEAADITTTAPDGTVTDLAQDVKDIESGALTADAWEPSDMKVRVYGDAAVVTGRSMIKNGKYKGADGKVMDISGEYRFTDTFIKRNGRWQCVATQGTKIQKS
ncbi:MAG: nuclear transport factor 2 family protein [Pyrinomonadaceae bacterium]